MIKTTLKTLVDRFNLAIFNLRHRAIKWLAQDDLVVIGDIYHKEGDPSLVQVKHGLILGNVKSWDGPSVIVHRGSEPRKDSVIGAINLCLSSEHED